MAAVRISDIVEPQVYLDYQAEDSLERTALVQSGIVVQSPVLAEKAKTGGRIVDIPFWKDLAQVEANVSNDDPAVLANPQNVGTGTQVARIAYLNQVWAEADLASDIAGSDALKRIKNRVESYWAKQFQRRILASVVGIVAENIAVNGGDMSHDISTDAAGAPVAGELFSRAAFSAAAFSLGDAFESTSTIAVHSVVYKKMIDNDDIVYIKPSVGDLQIPMFLGKRVIIDDGLPAIPGVNRIRYTSILFGAGAFGYGEGSPEVPVEVYRQPLQANGGGVESLISRKTWLVHPYGYAFNSASVSGISPSQADLKNPANWVRVSPERKQIPMSFLITNG